MIEIYKEKKNRDKTAVWRGVRRVGGHWARWQEEQGLMRGEPEEKTARTDREKVAGER